MLPTLTIPRAELAPTARVEANGPRPIFVIDDDLIAQIMIARALEAAGISNPVVDFSDGHEVIVELHRLDQLGAAHIPALVFLDWQMPGCDGIEVLRWMRGTAGLAHVPVIMLSAEESAQQVRQAYDLGASSYLVKPLAFTALGSVVRGMGLSWQIA